MSITEDKPRKKSKRLGLLEDFLREKGAACGLSSWNAFAETAHVPAELLPALASNRPELLKLAKPRAMSADEVKVLYDLIAVQMKTNIALREHAQYVADSVTAWSNLFKPLDRIGRQIDDFAQFREIVEDDEG